MNREMAHWGGFFGFGDSEQLSGVKSLLQDPLVADTDWNQGHVKHFPFQEWVQYDIQQAWRWTGQWEVNLAIMNQLRGALCCKDPKLCFGFYLLMFFFNIFNYKE